jgi:putative transposase
MGNHYHLCLRTPKGNLSRVMRHIDRIYTQRFNRPHGRDGALFRGRYKAIVVDADKYLAAVVRYIHLNAVKTGLATMPKEYRWTSHSYYCHGKENRFGSIRQKPWSRLGEGMHFRSFCYRVVTARCLRW